VSIITKRTKLTTTDMTIKGRWSNLSSSSWICKLSRKGLRRRDAWILRGTGNLSTGTAGWRCHGPSKQGRCFSRWSSLGPLCRVF